MISGHVVVKAFVDAVIAKNGFVLDPIRPDTARQDNPSKFPFVESVRSPETTMKLGLIVFLACTHQPLKIRSVRESRKSLCGVSEAWMNHTSLLVSEL